METAILSYAILLTVTLILLWIIIRIKIKNKKMFNELHSEKFKNKELADIAKIKSRFFANLSHEFRTMLTLITGPLDFIKKNLDEEIFRQNVPMRAHEQVRLKLSQDVAQKNLQIIQNNALLLRRLVNQLLDMAKLDTGKLALKTRPIEIISALKHIVESFTPNAQNKGIEISFLTDREALFTFIDNDKFEIIINNILTNAIKFTPSDGNVFVTIQRINNSLNINNKNTDCVEIKISDTGIGIDKKNIDKIFDRFYQVEDSKNDEQKGTGVGLSLTKDLILLHYGTIEVSSVLEEGTIFTIKLPIGKDHLKEREIVAEFITISHKKDIPDRTPTIEKNKTAQKESLPLILIVEDNYEMRYYLKSCLELNYIVAEAANGKEGLNLALEKIPDIIISDIMMDGMDGITLCKKIKEDYRLNHIPIILLTARAEDKDKIKGFESGADDYIIKPFNEMELLARIINLIKQRKAIREKIKKEILLEPENISVISNDEKFISKAKNIVQANISECDFTVEKFASEIALSRFHLNRKLHQIIDMSPSRFIREIRLKKAAQLLEQKKGNVSEIALDVGFDNFAYFNRCFKERFGCPPSKYLQGLN